MATNLATSQSITGGLIGKSEKKHRLKQRFEVMRKLGQGTYGKVQLAVNKETGQEVAIKTIKKSKIENENDLVRIRREIQIMSSIQHPYIIHIFEVFENKDKIVLVMQYARGGELYEYVNERKKLNDNEARRIFRQIATAIYYCHKNKVCHRDLKLENILLDEKGNAKIGDFGLSNVFDLRNCLNTFCGSPLYASPEIVKGTPYYGPEVDCWSLGVLLYTLVYGAMPFDGSNYKSLVKLISEANYLEPKIKSEASDLIKKLLCVQPNKRATIIDICKDAWVNKNCERSLLQVAEDLANLTPVKIEVLLALAPISQLNKQNINENNSSKFNLHEKEPKISILEPPTEEPVKRKKSTKKPVDKDATSKKNKLEKENEASKTKTKTVIKDNNNNLDDSATKINKSSKLSKSSLNQDSDYVSEELNSLGKKTDDKKSLSSVSQLKTSDELSLNDSKGIKNSNETNKRSSDKLVQSKLKNELELKNEQKTKETNKFLISNNEEKISPISNLTRKPSTKAKINKSSLLSNSTNKDNCLNKDNKTLSGSNEIKKIDDDQSTKNSFQVTKSQSKIGDAKRLFEKPRRQDSTEGEKQERIVVLNKVSDVKNKFERRASVNTTNSSVWKNKSDNQPENEIKKKTLSKNTTAASTLNNDLILKNSSLNEKALNTTTNSSIKNSINDKSLSSKPKLIERQSTITNIENDKTKNAAQLAEKTNLKMRRHTVKAKTSGSPSVTLAELKRKTSSKEKISENSNIKQNDAIKNDSNKNDQSSLFITNNKTEKPSKNAIEVNIVSRSTTPTSILSPVSHKPVVEISTSKNSLTSESFNSPTHTLITENSKYNFIKPNQQSKILSDKNNLSSLSGIKPVDDILPSKFSETSLNLSSNSSNFAPIARSYKKISFTKDGATIMETGKIISEETPSGTKITKKIITKKSKTPGSFNEVMETRNASFDSENDEFSSLRNDKNKNFKNKFDSFSKSSIKKSDSTSSSGSIDVFDDIFDTWVGDPMFNNLSSKLKSFFNNQPNNSSSLLSNNSFSRKANFPSFLNKAKSSSTNKRAESCERKLNDEPASSLISGNNSSRNFFRKAGYSTEGESDTDNEENLTFSQNVGLWKYLTPNSLSSRLLNKHRSILNDVDFFNENFANPSMLNNTMNHSRDRLKFDSKPPALLYNRIKSASREFFEPNDTVYKTTYLLRPDGSKKTISSSHKNQDREFSETNNPLSTKLDRTNSNQYSEFEMEINSDFRPNLPLTLGRIKPQNLNRGFNRSLSSKPLNNNFIENTNIVKQRVFEIPIEKEKTKTEYFIPIARQSSSSLVDNNPDNSSLLDQLRTHGYRNLVNQRNSKPVSLNSDINNLNSNETNDQMNYFSSSNNTNGSKHKKELFNLSEKHLINSKNNKTDNYSLLLDARNKNYLSSKNYSLFTKSETLDQLNCINLIKKTPLLKHFSSKTKEKYDFQDDENEIIIYGSDEDDSELKRQVIAQNKLLLKNNYDSKKIKLGSANNLISQKFENGSQIKPSFLSDCQNENLNKNKKYYDFDLRRRKSTSDKLYSLKDENNFEDNSESLNNSSDSVFNHSTQDTDDLLSCSINNQVNQIQHLIKLLYSENDDKKNELSEQKENKFLNKMNKGTDKILQKTQFDLDELKNDLQILQLKNKFQRRMKNEISCKNEKNDLKTKNKKLSNTDSFLSTSTETSSTNTVTPTSEEEDDSMLNKTSNLYKSLPPLPPGQNKSLGLISNNKLVNSVSKNSLDYAKQLKLIDPSDQLNVNLIKSNLRTFASNGNVLLDCITKNSKLNDQNHLYQTNLSCSTLNREHGMSNKSSSSINSKSSFSSCRSSSSLIGLSKSINQNCQANKNNELTRRSTVSNGSSLSSSKETLQERILRKSFYSRFNSPDRSLENNLYQQKKVPKKSSFYSSPYNNISPFSQDIKKENSNKFISKSYSNLNDDDSILDQELESEKKINSLIMKRAKQSQSPYYSNLNKTLDNGLKHEDEEDCSIKTIVNRRNSFSYGTSKSNNLKSQISNSRNVSSKTNYMRIFDDKNESKNMLNDSFTNYQNTLTEVPMKKNYLLVKNYDDNNNFHKNYSKSIKTDSDIIKNLYNSSSKLNYESFSKNDLNNLVKTSSKNQLIKKTNSFKKNEKKTYPSNYIKLSS